MALGSWGTDAVVLPDAAESNFPHWAPPATVQCDVGTGTVVISVRDVAGTGWLAIETIDTDDASKVIDVANMPAIRISVTGDAQFRAIWQRTGA